MNTVHEEKEEYEYFNSMVVEQEDEDCHTTAVGYEISMYEIDQILYNDAKLSGLKKIFKRFIGSLSEKRRIRT